MLMIEYRWWVEISRIQSWYPTIPTLVKTLCTSNVGRTYKFDEISHLWSRTLYEKKGDYPGWLSLWKLRFSPADQRMSERCREAVLKKRSTHAVNCLCCRLPHVLRNHRWFLDLSPANSYQLNVDRGPSSPTSSKWILKTTSVPLRTVSPQWELQPWLMPLYQPSWDPEWRIQL